MIISKLLTVAVLVVAAVGAAAAPAIKLDAITGVVQIKTAGGVMDVKAGEPVPGVPSGAEIIVVSGDAVVESGGVVVKAGSGDSFTINVGGKAAVEISVTGGLVSIVGADGVSKDVAKGETVSLAAKAGRASVAKVAPKKAKEKKDKAAPESIPADAPAPPPSSPVQEKATAAPCINTTVSPSTPC